MPRQARLDVAGTLHHVMLRGIEKKQIFDDALDREGFVNRLHRSQVCRFANREDIRPFIEQEQMKFLEAVPDAAENVKGLVREMKDIPKGDTKRRELSYRARLDTFNAVGIMPRPIQAQVITTIYNDHRNQIIAPVVQELLNQLLPHSSDPIQEEEEPRREG